MMNRRCGSPSTCLTLWMTLALLPVAGAEEGAPSDPPAGAEQSANPAGDDPSAPEIAAGHSMHGEAFNTGPRQAAVLMEGTGNVHFPCTCDSTEVQQFVDQGVGQLHGFWYYEAERSFRQAAQLDPDCAIAYWGMAMANVNNAARAKLFIAEAAKRKEPTTRREQLYIETLDAFHKAETKGDADKKRREALVKGYEKILHEFPDDIEAKAFLGWYVHDNRAKGVSLGSYFAVDALLQDVIEQNPLHPCHHYVIHLWDYEKPERALKSAAMCGPAGPTIAHMWHMSGHIYSRLKRYHDAVWQQEASARLDHRHQMQSGLLPDQIHNFAHNNEWLIRNLIFIGRAHDALTMAMNLIDHPRHPQFNTLKKGSANYGRLRFAQVVNDFELWDDLLKLKETRYLEPTAQSEEQLKRVRLIARAYLRSGDLDGAQPTLTELRERRDGLQRERDEAIARVERVYAGVGKSKDEIEEAVKEERDKYNKQLGPLGETLHELDGLEHLAQGRFAEALESLGKAGKQPAFLMALANLRAGKSDKAIELVTKEVRGKKHETVPLANQVYIQWEAGKKDDARKAFESLRTISATIDLSSPVFVRLAPIAQELGWPEDWRQPLEVATDLGERPPLDSFGPAYWQPSPAPEWTLVDNTATPWSLSHFNGKPVVVIFYLGHGCLHCAEQLQKFSPMAAAFREAGIELIAVSTDPPEQLQLKLAAFADTEFTFPLVSDAALDVFRKYRCFDDFEGKPLHGTFLIDAAGRDRWHDIGADPFMDPKFVLAEAKRLLTDGPVDPEVSAATAGAKADDKDDADKDDAQQDDADKPDGETARSDG